MVDDVLNTNKNDVFGHLREVQDNSHLLVDEQNFNEVSETTEIAKSEDELVYDGSFGQSDYNWQPFKDKVIPDSTMFSYQNYGKVNPENTVGWNFRQDSFFETDEWKNFSTGFMNENIMGIMWNAINSTDQLFPADANYNVFEDQELQPITKKDFHYYANSNSKQETLHLINQKYREAELYNKPFWQILGTLTGGVTDISSVILFSKLAKPIFMGSKMNRLKKTSAILGVEEGVKQVVDEDRPLMYGAMVLGTNALFQLLLPVFKTGFSATDKNALKNFVLRSDLDDEIKHIEKNKEIQIIYTTNTGRWIRPDGKVINVGQKSEFDVMPTGWIQKSATMQRTEKGYVIRVNKKLLEKQFKEKAWTKPQMQGVNPLPADAFKTIDEWQEFILAHEKGHTYIPQKAGEAKPAYENRINQEALKRPIVPYSHFKAGEYLQNTSKYLQELENEQFVPTWLGKLGESSNWNPIQRMVNRGNLTAIKFAKSILKSPLLTKGNLEGEASTSSLSNWLKLDYNNLMTAVDTVSKSYSKYKKSTKGTGTTPITRIEFNQRVSKGIINRKYKDALPEVQEATKAVKDYYKFVGEKIKASNPALNTQILKVSELERLLKSGQKEFVHTYADGTTKKFKLNAKDLRKRIKAEKKYLEQLRKNPLREDYLNRVINRDKIKANIPAWREFAMASLRKTMPELNDDELMVIVKSYENKLPYKKHKKNDINKSHEDIIMEEYFFSPSGMSGNLKARKLQIDQEEWMRAGYFHSDPSFLMSMYHRSVLPDVYLTSIFGTPNAMGGGWFSARGYQPGLKNIEAEYRQKWNSASTSAEKKLIEKEMKESLKDAEAIRDLYRGVYGVSDDPSSFYSQGISMMKMFNAMTSLQGGLASIVDLGRSVFFNGVSRSLKATFESFTSDTYKLVYAQAKKEGRAAGELFELQSHARAMNMNNLETMYNTGSKITAGMQKVNSAFFLVNGMSIWNQMIKTHMTAMIQTRVLEEIGNWANGTITKLNKAKLAQAGINEQDAIGMWREFIEHGKGVGAKNNGGIKYNRMAFSEDWYDPALTKKFNFIIENDLNIGIITPALNDTPLWMSTQLGGILAQFKKFSMGMTQRMMIRGFQEKDANFFGGVVMMVALGAVIDMMRSRAFNQDYSQKDFHNKMMDAFERSGVGGIFMDVGNSAHRIIADDLGGKLGGALGPTGSNIDKLLNVMINSDDSAQASNVRRLIPFQNIWYLDSLFDRIETGIK